jgi:hypothetical protein
MKWASTIQTANSFEKSLSRAIEDIKDGLGASRADLGVLFVFGYY